MTNESKFTTEYVNKLKDHCISLELASVYDIEKYSVQELLYMLARKMNELVSASNVFQENVSNEVDRQTALLQQLIDGGIDEYVIDQMNKWHEDGTFAEIIEGEVFQSMSSKIDDLGAKSEELKQGLNEYSQKVNETQDNLKRKSFAIAGVDYIGHRGLAFYAPENTLQAFIEAGERGFKYIEADISELSDGEFCIMHDNTVDRTTDGTGAVSTFSSTTIKNLNITKGKWSGYFNYLKVPMLSEYLETCKRYNAVPVIEIKNIKSLSSVARLYQKVAEVIDPELCIFASFDINQLREVVKINENVRVCLFINPTTGNMDIMSKVGKNPIIGADHTLFNKANVQYAHSLGLKTNAYTVNNQEIADNLKAMQVDFITTDGLIDSSNDSIKCGGLNNVFRQSENLKTDVDSLISNAINKPQHSKEKAYRLNVANAVNLTNGNVVGKTPFENFNTEPSNNRVVFFDKIYFNGQPSLSIKYDATKFKATILCYDENDRYLYDLGWIPRSGMMVKIPYGASYGFIYFKKTDDSRVTTADIAEFISGGGIVSLTPGTRLITPTSLEWASVAPTIGNKYATIFASEPTGTRAVSNVFYTNGANTLRIMKAENVEISVLQFNSIDALIKATSGWETKNADIKLMNECVYFVLYLRKTDNTNILDDDYLKMFEVKCSLTNK